MIWRVRKPLPVFSVKEDENICDKYKGQSQRICHRRNVVDQVAERCKRSWKHLSVKLDVNKENVEDLLERIWKETGPE